MSAELSQYRAKDRSLEDSTVNACGLRSYLPVSPEATYHQVRSYRSIVQKPNVRS
jgi:hypothetical protein